MLSFSWSPRKLIKSTLLTNSSPLIYRSRTFEAPFHKFAQKYHSCCKYFSSKFERKKSHFAWSALDCKVTSFCSSQNKHFLLLKVSSTVLPFPLSPAKSKIKSLWCNLYISRFFSWYLHQQNAAVHSLRSKAKLSKETQTKEII